MSSESSPSEPAAPSLEELAPQFPAYEFEGLIAQGGMGAVYKARQLSLDRPVAIKILPRGVGDDPVFRASFEAEARAMARLNHPNLVGVYDFGETDGLLFIIMEYVHGNSLHRSCVGKAIDPAQAGEIVSAICRGLDHAHENGIVHRDIKPGNVLIDANANPKIGDFGLASPMGARAGADEAIYGTPGYAAPEIYKKQAASARSDIYAVGVLLAELLTGKTPAQDRPRPPSLSCGCPREFDAIVARATNPNPEMRYPDAGTLADDIDDAVKASSAKGTAANRLIMTPPPTVLKTAVPAQSPKTSMVVAKRSLALPLSIAGLAVAIVFYAVMAGPGSRDNSDASKPAADADEESIAPPNPVAPASATDAALAAEIFAAGQQAALTENTETPLAGVEDPTEPQRESPLVSLATLKEKLAAGARDEFPVGTEMHNDSHFLLIDRLLTWADARRFAEEHGAHLAVLSVASDRLWFRDTFEPERPLWIGAGVAANDRWQWLDGSRWLPIDTPRGALEGHRLMALSSAGKLTPAKADRPFHFAIQWRSDGQNPATIGAELRRTTASIESAGIDAAVYPVGTRTFEPERSHFFAIPKATTWEAARQLATAAKGYLAVPSSPEENDWIRARFSEANASGNPATLWIGGFQLKPNTPWQWLTREAWNSSAWLVNPATSDPKSNRVLLSIGADPISSGWLASDGAEGGAAGLLVEWSQPKKPATIASFDLDSWLSDVDEKFIERVKPDLEKYDKERSEEVDKYVKGMRSEARKLDSRLEDLGLGELIGQRGGAAGTLIDESMNRVEKTGEILDDLPRFVPGEFRDIQERTEKSIAKLDKELDEKLTSHRQFYSGGLVKKSAELAKSGFGVASKALTGRVDSIGDSNEKFLGVLNLGEAPGDVEDPAAGAADG